MTRKRTPPRTARPPYRRRWDSTTQGGRVNRLMKEERRHEVEERLEDDEELAEP